MDASTREPAPLACVLILETPETIERAEQIEPTTNIAAEHQLPVV